MHSQLSTVALTTTTLMVALLCVGESRAWWCTGHMTVNWIAKQNLADGVYETVNGIAQALSAQGPFPMSPDFVQTACWADDLKSYGLAEMEGWHFINQPYDPTNFPIAKWPIQDENVETLIHQLSDTIHKHSSPAWDLHFAFGNLVHFYGDIHQPLHATELFSSEYPTGDLGGNLEKVTVDGTSTVLHFVWDAICWEYSADLPRPLNEANYAIVKNFGEYLMNTYTFTDAQKSEWNSTVMALESLNDAIEYAYPGTYSGMTISAAYLARCKPVAEGRVALAGYRLASELNYLFGSSGSSSSGAGLDLSSPDGQRAAAKKIRERVLRHKIHAHNLKMTHREKILALHHAMAKNAPQKQ